MRSSYSPIERFFARKLESNPKLKYYIKRLYQHLNFLVFVKNYKSRSKFDVLSISDSGESFFGYYDKSPINVTNEFVIYQETNYSTKKSPNSNHFIKVIAKNIKSNTIIFEFETNCYNWQQGTKLQWISKFSFVFNAYSSEEKKYISIVVDANTGKILHKNTFPIYDVYGDICLSLNFDRLNSLRPDYGYRNIVIDKIPISDIDNDGIFKFTIGDSKKNLIISIRNLISEFPINVPQKVKVNHKVNHIMISPNGEKFVFMHRFFINGKKYDRLFVSDICGTNIKLLSDHEMVSHYCWYGNENIVGYMRRYENGDKYYKLNISTGKFSVIGEGLIDSFGDGHPIICNDLMLFDTYPNKSRFKSLYVFDLRNNVLEKLGVFLNLYLFMMKLDVIYIPNGVLMVSLYLLILFMKE